MNRRTLTCFALLASLTCAFPAQAAEFTVSDLSLVAGVIGPSPVFAGVVFSDVALPFADSHAADYELSSAAASYDLDYGRFLINAALDSEAGDSTDRSSVASGRFHITPLKDLHVQYHGRFDFDLPADSMTAGLNFFVSRPQRHFSDTRTRTTHTQYDLRPRSPHVRVFRRVRHSRRPNVVDGVPV